MVLTVYALEHSRSRRIFWLLEELGMKYDVEYFYRKNMRADQALKEIHPSGKAPIIRDGELVLPESGCIVEYIIEKYGKGSELEPKSEVEKWHISAGITNSESNMMIAGMQCVLAHMAKTRLPYGVSYIAGKLLGALESVYARPELELNLKTLDAAIARNGGYYVGGHLSGADIMYETSVFFVKAVFDDFDSRYPNIAKWLEMLHARPAFQKAMQLDESYTASKPRI